MTADELSVSVWSSDVCSSYLMAFRGKCVPAHQRFSAAEGQHVRRIGPSARTTSTPSPTSLWLRPIWECSRKKNWPADASRNLPSFHQCLLPSALTDNRHSDYERSEVRRVGKECDSTGRSRRSQVQYNKNTNH